MIIYYPEIAKEWDYVNNKKYDLENISFGSKKKYFWICSKCKSSYDSSPVNRKNGYGCPYCRGLKVNHTNSLNSISLNLSKQWHPTKNNSLTPHDVTKSHPEKVWWLGKCGHEWKTKVSDRLRGCGCPYCSNKKILLGFNDLWTTHPHVAINLTDPEVGRRFTHGSGEKVSWSCVECIKVIGYKNIKTVVTKGLNCPLCKKTGSFSERIMSFVLIQLDVIFESQKSFSWLSNRRYDFYIKDKNIIIETHGEQHYKNNYKNGRTLSEEKENDALKESSANNNGIKNYIVIDCMRSDFNYIKRNILNSELTEFYDMSDIDWNDIFVKSNKSTLLAVCKIYNSEDITQIEIAKRLRISPSSVIRYLADGASHGLCNYKANSNKGKFISIKHMKKPVIQMDLNYGYIRKFDSIAEASKHIGAKSSSGISGVCAKRKKTSGGFRWMHEEEFINMTQE